VYKDFIEENQPQKVNSKSINNIKILICPVWAFEMILYLQVGYVQFQLVKQYFSHLSHSIPSFDMGPANQKRSYITFIFKTNLTLD
jgi:hypothetical protein